MGATRNPSELTRPGERRWVLAEALQTTMVFKASARESQRYGSAVCLPPGTARQLFQGQLLGPCCCPQISRFQTAVRQCSVQVTFADLWRVEPMLSLAE